MKYIDSEKLIAEIERRLKIVEPHKDTFESAAACRQELIWMKEFITPLQQEQPNASKGKFNFPKFLYARTLDNKTIDISYAPQTMEAIEYVRNDFVEQEQPMPNSTELIAKWEEEKDVLKQMDFRGNEWRLAQNAFMDGVGIGLSVKQEQPLTIEKVVEQCKRFGGNPQVIKHEQKCIFGNIPSEDICSVCSAYCSLRVPKTKVSTSTEITAPSRQVEKLTFEEYLRGVFEINNGIENDPDNLVRIHAPELLKLARKQEQPEVDNQ